MHIQATVTPLRYRLQTSAETCHSAQKAIEKQAEAKLKLAAIYEQSGDGSWSGHVESDPGICVATGDALDEARANLQDSLRFHLEEGDVPLHQTIGETIEVA